MSFGKPKSRNRHTPGRVLVISPHPDDESIGCGGTLRQHVVQGDLVHVVFLTSGEKGGHGRTEQETLQVREREARAAARVLGIQELEFWREPDGSLRSKRSVVGRLRNALRSFRPDLLYVPHEAEMHPDHKAANRLVRTALSNTSRSAKPQVMQFEVWTPLQRIDQIVDVSRYMKVKLSAIRKHRSQCAVMDFHQAILGLNRYRGEMHSWPGGDYAEVFALLERRGSAL